MACAGLCVSWSQQTEPNYLNPAWTSENEQTGKGYYITDTACLSEPVSGSNVFKYIKYISI